MAALVIFLLVVIILAVLVAPDSGAMDHQAAQARLRRHAARRQIELTLLRTQLRADAARARRELDRELDEDEPWAR